MRKLKIFLLVIYIISILLIIFESSLNSKNSSKISNFAGDVFSNIVDKFIKNKYIHLSDITYDIENTLYVDEEYNLNAKIEPYNASFKSITYSSSNDDILVVDDFGNVKFKDSGRATIYIKQLDENFTKEVIVNGVAKPIPIIPNNPIKDISINLSINEIYAGDIADISINITPNDYSLDSYTLDSSNEEIFKIIDEKIYALKGGTADLIIKTSSGLEKKKTVNVIEKLIDKPTIININNITDTLNVNDEIFLETSTNSSLDIYNRFIYKIDEEYLSISNNTLKALKAGNTKLVIETIDGVVKKEYDILIKNILPEYELSDMNIVIGTSKTLEIAPVNNPTYTNYKYIVDNETIVSIDKVGVITPRKRGETKVKIVVDDSYQIEEKEIIIKVENKSITNINGFNFGKFVRKILGHFSCYLLLGFIGLITMFLWIKKHYKNIPLFVPTSLLVGLFVALLTEVIQHFTEGRYGTIKDSLIDFTGYSLGTALMLIIIILYLKRRKIKENKE